MSNTEVKICRTIFPLLCMPSWCVQEQLHNTVVFFHKSELAEIIGNCSYGLLVAESLYHGYFEWASGYNSCHSHRYRLFLLTLHFCCYFQTLGHVVTRLTHCATGWKVVDSIPDALIGIFYWHNPSAKLWPWGLLSFWHTWVLGTFPGGKGGWCIGLTTLPPSCTYCHEIWEPQHHGTLWVCPGMYRDCFTITFYSQTLHFSIRNDHQAFFDTVLTIKVKYFYLQYHFTWIFQIA
jgi:hypothetical protein